MIINDIMYVANAQLFKAPKSLICTLCLFITIAFLMLRDIADVIQGQESKKSIQFAILLIKSDISGIYMSSTTDTIPLFITLGLLKL